MGASRPQLTLLVFSAHHEVNCVYRGQPCSGMSFRTGAQRFLNGRRIIIPTYVTGLCVPRQHRGDVAALIAPSAPEGPHPMTEIMEDFERVVMPGITHWQHPRFFAYFPANAAPPSMLAGDVGFHNCGAMHAMAKPLRQPRRWRRSC